MSPSPAALRAWLEARKDLAFELVRIYLGVGLFAKGLMFLARPAILEDLLKRSGAGWFAPTAIVHYVALAHVAGGLLLAVGLGTRLAALAQVPILAGAVFLVHLPHVVLLEPHEELDFAALVLFLLVLIVVHGPGRLAADTWLTRQVEEQEARAARADLAPARAARVRR